VLGTARGPGCSPHRLGVEGSLDVIAALAESLPVPADLAMLLLAALDFADEEEAYGAAARRRGWAAATEVGNDTFAVLRAGTESGFGVAVTCGAGINCVGVAPDGRRVRFASLGEVSGDWGGGTDVGVAALGAAVRSADGRGPRTVLAERVPAYYGYADPTSLARAVHAKEVPYDRLGELAPLTFALAEEDDVAGAIVDRLADEVVAFARAALTRLDLAREAVDVVLGGSLLQSGSRRLLARIEAGVREVGAELRVRAVDAPPILGAALLGLDRLGADGAARARLRAELGAAV
jgi:N-acetylglucosamine kinase-like BadF-type ATPase